MDALSSFPSRFKIQTWIHGKEKKNKHSTTNFVSSAEKTNESILKEKKNWLFNGIKHGFQGTKTQKILIKGTMRR